MSALWGISVTEIGGPKNWAMRDQLGHWSLWSRPIHASWWETEEAAAEARSRAPDLIRFDGRVEQAPPGLFQAEDYAA